MRETRTTSASSHATTTVHVRPGPRQRLLIKPDVRFSRLRLSNDRSDTGFRRELTAWPMQIDQPLFPQGGIQRGAAQPTTPLAPCPQQATKPDLQKPVDLLEGPTGVAKAEAAAPTTQKPVDPPDHRRGRQPDICARQPTPPLPDAIQRPGRRHDVEIPPTDHEPAAIITKGTARKSRLSPGSRRSTIRVLSRFGLRPRLCNTWLRYCIILAPRSRAQITQSSTYRTSRALTALAGPQGP